MAGEARLTRLLLGLGLRNFSMHPAHLLEIKQRVLATSCRDIKVAVAKLRRIDDPAKIAAALDRINA
jgi:phosphoenolpyruvate-protein phosphotransferase (PTS system enzyme I)